MTINKLKKLYQKGLKQKRKIDRKRKITAIRFICAQIKHDCKKGHTPSYINTYDVYDVDRRFIVLFFNIKGFRIAYLEQKGTYGPHYSIGFKE